MMLEAELEQWVCSHCGRTAWIEYHGVNPDCLGHLTFSEMGNN